MLLRIRKRLTYANVMATIAVFIALGGSSYALSQINGNNIRNRSIVGKKLKTHSVTAKEIDASKLNVPHAKSATHANATRLAITALAADKVKGFHITAAKSWHGHKAASVPRSGRAHVAAATPAAPTTMVGLNAGQTVPLLSSGPFTFSAKCVDDQHELFTATSSEAGWFTVDALSASDPYDHQLGPLPPYAADDTEIIGAISPLAGSIPYPLQLVEYPATFAGFS